MKDSNASHLFFTHGLASMSGSLLNALYFLIDAMFIGHWVGAKGLAAASACFPILLLVGASGQVIIRGTSALYSECLGSGDEGVKSKLWPAFACWGILVPLGFAIGVAVAARPLLSLMLSHSPEIIELGVPYLRIYAFNYVLITLNLGLVGFLRCEGKRLVITLIFAETTLLNLLLDYLFLEKFNLGLESTAVACMIANLIAFLSGLAIIYPLDLIKKSKPFALYPAVLYQIVNRGAYTFLMQSLTIVHQGTLYSLTAASSQVALVAVMGATLNIHNFVVSPMFGLSLSFQSILGLAYGAKDHARIRDVFRTYLVLTSGVCLLFSAAIISHSDRILQHFVNDSSISQAYLNHFMIGIVGVVSYGSLVIGMIYLQTLNQLRDVVYIIFGRFALQIAFAVSLWLTFGSLGLFYSLCVSDILSLGFVIFQLFLRRRASN